MVLVTHRSWHLRTVWYLVSLIYLGFARPVLLNIPYDDIHNLSRIWLVTSDCLKFVRQGCGTVSMEKCLWTYRWIAAHTNDLYRVGHPTKRGLLRNFNITLQSMNFCCGICSFGCLSYRLVQHQFSKAQTPKWT